MKLQGATTCCAPWIGQGSDLFLFGLKQEQMSRTDFPLGEFDKSAVREIARQAALPVADKPESQEICFVPSGNYVQFIEAYLGNEASHCRRRGRPGNDQRRSHRAASRSAPLHCRPAQGLGIAAGRPLYVVELNHAANRVVVGDDAELRSEFCEVRDVNWISFAALEAPVRATVKIRHRHEPAAATVEPIDATSARVKFDVPQRAITPGQAAVFYSGTLFSAEDGFVAP